MDDRLDPRSPLDASTLQAVAGPRWAVTLLPTASSTNELAAADPQPGRVVVADYQLAGRGRLDRSWTTPAGTGLTLSAVIAPRLELRHWPLIPLATGLAVADALRSLGADPTLKWPNDVLLETGKVAGILVERVGEPACAVVGIGINVDLAPAELPVPTASSLSIAGISASRTEVFGAVLSALETQMGALEGDPSGFVARYRDRCGTVGRDVEAHLPGGVREVGRAIGIDDQGRLEIQVGGRTLAMAAGDVVHLRPL